MVDRGQNLAVNSPIIAGGGGGSCRFSTAPVDALPDSLLTRFLDRVDSFERRLVQLVSGRGGSGARMGMATIAQQPDRTAVLPFAMDTAMFDRVSEVETSVVQLEASVDRREISSFQLQSEISYEKCRLAFARGLASLNTSRYFKLTAQIAALDSRLNELGCRISELQNNHSPSIVAPECTEQIAHQVFDKMSNSKGGCHDSRVTSKLTIDGVMMNVTTAGEKWENPKDFDDGYHPKMVDKGGWCNNHEDFGVNSNGFGHFLCLEIGDYGAACLCRVDGLESSHTQRDIVPMDIVEDAGEEMHHDDEGLDSSNDSSYHLPISDKGGGCTDLGLNLKGLGHLWCSKLGDSVDMDVDKTPEGEEKRGKPMVVILVGAPGSGKSTFCEHIMRSSTRPWARVRQDTIKGKVGTKAQCIESAMRALKDVKSVFIDRCNLEEEQREDFVKLRDAVLEILDDVVVQNDMYPKEKRHLLVVARYEGLDRLADVRSEHLQLLKTMHDVGLKWAEKFLHDNSSLVFRIGYHSEPSMRQLHLHVISQNKKHWNSFNTVFFLLKVEAPELVQ